MLRVPNLKTRTSERRNGPFYPLGACSKTFLKRPKLRTALYNNTNIDIVLSPNRLLRASRRSSNPMQILAVGAEILVKRRSGSETDHGNVAAKRDDQARQEQWRMRRRVARAPCHRASGGRGTRCNSPRIPSACAPGPRRSRKIPDRGTHAGSFRSAVRRTDARPERTEPT